MDAFSKPWSSWPRPKVNLLIVSGACLKVVCHGLCLGYLGVSEELTEGYCCKTLRSLISGLVVLEDSLGTGAGQESILFKRMTILTYISLFLIWPQAVVLIDFKGCQG